jgi:hypothetical protein
MLFDFKRCILLTSIAVAFGGFNGGDKEHAKFEPLPVDQYPNHQTENGVTLASLPYETKQQAEPAFGKVNPYEYGVLPILLVIRNNSKAAIRVDRIHVQYMWPDRTKIDPTPPRDVKYIGAKAPGRNIPTPLPMGIPHASKPKQPLGEWEIEGRAFAAEMIPPGESAHGFFYFQTGHRTGSTLFVSGLKNATTNQELIYFELPLAAVQ